MNKNQQLKSEIRQTIRKRRQGYSRSENSLAGEQLCQHLNDHQIPSHYHSVACFLSFDGEIATQPIVDQIITQNGLCYLPKLKPAKPNRLWFMPYNHSSLMTNNPLGIPEVDLTVNHAIAVSKLDLVLFPLVAFDNFGNRLGMGGGYYDATFAHLRNAKKRPKFIGVAFDRQKVDQLPKESWDLPLDGVCTEQQFYDFGNKPKIPSPQPSPGGRGS